MTNPTKTSVLNNLRKNNGEIDEDKKEQKAASNQGYDGKFALGDKQNKEGPKLTDGIDGRWEMFKQLKKNLPVLLCRQRALSCNLLGCCDA